MIDFSVFAGDVQGVDEELIRSSLKDLQQDICDKLELPINTAYDERLAEFEAALWQAAGENEAAVRHAYMKLDIVVLAMHGEIEAAAFRAGLKAGAMLGRWPF